mmetsp:Transcript_158373/g.507977  ORF Transcript_158373/g.507977 Transcript_158373/m.507977 type:complete len:214 (-) Transcript_158373:1736-2377(-)
MRGRRRGRRPRSRRRSRRPRARGSRWSRRLPRKPTPLRPRPWACPRFSRRPGPRSRGAGSRRRHTRCPCLSTAAGSRRNANPRNSAARPSTPGQRRHWRRRRWQGPVEYRFHFHTRSPRRSHCHRSIRHTPRCHPPRPRRRRLRSRCRCLAKCCCPTAAKRVGLRKPWRWLPQSSAPQLQPSKLPPVKVKKAAWPSGWPWGRPCPSLLRRRPP